MASAKQIAVDCDAPIYAGITLVLNSRLEEMCALRSAALDWTDPEGVHDMRIALRRLRGAVRDFQPYLRKRRLSACTEQIREIARALGKVRDHDVAIMTLAGLAEKAPTDIAAGIQRFASLRDAERLEAREKLRPVLCPEYISRLTATFNQALQASSPTQRTNRSVSKTAAPAGNITYREVADSIIVKRLQQLETLSRSLQQPLKVKPLHEMRIAAKHLRYALELFEHCWGPPIAFFARKTAGLQSSLGKLHDCDVWIEDFGKAAMNDESASDFESKSATIWLLNHFVKLRSKHFGRTLNQWHEWQAKEFGKQLRECLLLQCA